MSERKRPLAEADPNSEPQKSPKEKANSTPSSAKTTTTNGEGSENAIPKPKFVCLPRPYWDIQHEKWDKRNEPKNEADAEDESDDDDDDDDDADGDESNDEQGTLPTGSAHENDPSWVWFMSEEGMLKYNYLEKQAANRDQDEHGLYVYSNFTAYGVNEVVDNWLKDFNKELCRRQVSPCTIWAHLEGLSFFLQLDYVDMWFQGDDSRGFAETISMVGKALLTGLYLLKNHKKSNPYLPENGGPKNISVILALFVEFVQSWDDLGGDHYEETAWVPRLGKLAEDNGIEIKGTYNFKQRTQDLFEPEEKTKKVRFEGGGNCGKLIIVDADSVDDDIKYSDDYSVKGWKEEFKAYTKGHATNGGKTIGGTHYDLTKISRAEKRAMQSGGGGWGW